MFDDVLLSCNIGLAKPNQAFYRHALKKLNINHKHCLFVGDGGDNELLGAYDSALTLF